MSELGTYKLPKGWQWTTIPDLANSDGIFIDGDWVESKDQDPNGDVRLIQLADVGDGVYRDKSLRFLTKTKAAELRCTFLKPGDVLVARMPDPLGRSCVFPGDAKPSVTVVDVCIVRSGKGDFNHRWLSWFINASPFRTAVAGLQAGSTRKRISRKNLGTISLPLPPLDEQHRIVAEIEKQFTRLEAGTSALKRVQANLKRYRAAVLKAACEGRLVPTEADLAGQEGRTYETGEQLLARILAERRRKWQGRGKYKEPAAPDITKLPSVPEGWCWLSVETIGFITKLAGFEYTKYVKYSADGDLAVIKAENAGRNGFKRTEISRIQSSSVSHLTRSQLKAGDLLMVFVGAGTGNVARVPDDQPYFLGPNIAMIRVETQDVSEAYLEMFLRSPLGNSLALGFAKAVAQPSLSMGTIRMIPVALPPIIEQKRIVAEVERRLSVIEEQEVVVSASLQRAARLRQSILERAFSGRLLS
jgi:type I restriction enzyme, S subunit